MNFSSFRYLVKQGWRNMVANRLMTLASMGVLSACLLITGVAALLSANVNSFVDYLETKNEVECFLDDAVSAEQADALRQQILGMDNVATCEYISKVQAVEDMKDYLGENAGVMQDFEGEGNTQNPLPASLRVSVTDVSLLAQTVNALQSAGGGAFYKIQSPVELSNTLVNLKRIVNVAGWGLVAVLGVVSAVVINNTIKLTVFARRKEINIMKFVGATNAFIRLPFFVEGMTVGALSGLLATGIVGGAYYGVLRAMQQPGAAWMSEFTRCMIPFATAIVPLLGGFVAFGMLIGGTGCATSIRKHLKV